jgi:hypothetical protein
MSAQVFKLKMIDNSNATYATGEEFALPAGNELYRLMRITTPSLAAAVT